MRTGHSKLLFVALLLFITLAVSPASAFYNPNTGRWLNRDPIEESGGVGLYAFTKNCSVNKIDLLGQVLVEHPTESIADWGQLTEAGVLAFTGDWPLRSMSRPHIIYATEDKISETICCAEVVRAQRVDVNVWTITVKREDAVVQGGGWFTANGYDVAMPQHEGRRREAYRKAYNAYIFPNTDVGPNVTKCGPICRSTVGQAKEELLQYVQTIRQRAIDKYNSWIEEQQRQIENERWSYVNGLADAIQNPHIVPVPDPLLVTPCPPPI